MQNYDNSYSHIVPLSIRIVCSIFMWFPLIISFITVWFLPTITIIFNIIVSFYIIITFLLMYINSLYAILKQKYLTNKFFLSSQWISLQKKFEYELLDGEKILHIVIIPVYNEELIVIDYTLESLAKQNVPMLVCVALEEREIQSETKYNDIIYKYKDRFIHIIKSIHPMNLPNEVPGKASNCDYAGRLSVEYYEEHLKNNYNHVMITACDCDSIWCSNYFLYLNYLCMKNDLNNFDHIAYVPNITNMKNFPSNCMISNWISVARFVGTHGHFRQLGFVRIFISEYHIPLYLMKRIDFWDRDIIHEDMHLSNKLAILDGYSVKFKCTYLPCDNTTPTDVNSIFGTFVVLWKQTKRWNMSVYNLYYLVHMLLLNLLKKKSYENFQANSWKIFFQLISNYQCFFYFFLASFSNYSFWILYICVFNNYNYVDFLLLYINPSFFILQLIFAFIYAIIILHSNDEIINDELYTMKKKIVFILGTIPWSFCFIIFQGLSTIAGWICTFKSVIIHSESTPKTINKQRLL